MLDYKKNYKQNVITIISCTSLMIFIYFIHYLFYSLLSLFFLIIELIFTIRCLICHFDCLKSNITVYLFRFYMISITYQTKENYRHI